MAETISMPKLGFDMAEGTLVRWVVTEGDEINKGDVLAEIETDKATVEVESSASGTVLKHLVDEGAIVPVSTPIAVVGEEGEEVSEQLTVDSGQSTEKPSPEATLRHRFQLRPNLPPSQSSISNQQSSIVKASPLAKKMAR